MDIHDGVHIWRQEKMTKTHIVVVKCERTLIVKFLLNLKLAMQIRFKQAHIINTDNINTDACSPPKRDKHTMHNNYKFNLLMDDYCSLHQ